jgi:hypothetical protein
MRATTHDNDKRKWKWRSREKEERREAKRVKKGEPINERRRETCGLGSVHSRPRTSRNEGMKNSRTSCDEGRKERWDVTPIGHSFWHNRWSWTDSKSFPLYRYGHGVEARYQLRTYFVRQFFLRSCLAFHKADFKNFKTTSHRHGLAYYKMTRLHFAFDSLEKAKQLFKNAGHRQKHLFRRAVWPLFTVLT